MRTKQTIAISAQHKRNLCNEYGTFTTEGMTISKFACGNLDCIGSCQISYHHVLRELRAKYERGIITWES